MHSMSPSDASGAIGLPSFFNTRGRKVEPLTIAEPGRASIYTCGPTVYRYAHLGNLRSFLLADLVVRICQFAGLKTRQVVNITDIGHMTDEVTGEGDDKILLAAEVEGKSPSEIADFYTGAFLDDCALAGMTPADDYPRASKHISEMIELIECLLDKGNAYVSGGSVYFDVSTFPGYGSLSGNSLKQLKPGHRKVVTDPQKRRAEDFLLWKAAGPRRLVKFPSPWSEGYPGWHIECSAMSLKLLGDRIDIHTAGIDLVFPHHEDEIAQSDAATGHRVVGHWIHGEHLLMSGNKMAKSAGNTLRMTDIAESGLDPLAFRLLMFGARYRKQVHFSMEALEAADTSLTRLRRAFGDLGEPLPLDELEMSSSATRAHEEFSKAVMSDIDTATAVRVLYSTASNRSIPSIQRVSLAAAWDRILGLNLTDTQSTHTPEPKISGEEVLELIKARDAARASRDFTEADRIRDRLAEAGVVLTDTPAGTDWYHG
ncbi:MAG: cysteine--tRNA ligase [Acidobacteria bacterium]|nr:MAG: cysteine--tRNA ligase [Acidobacteriota bacterium]